MIMLRRDFMALNKLSFLQKFTNKFQSSLNKSGSMSLSEKSSKQRRKKNADVPVHRINKVDGSNEREYKVYSAQFNGKRKMKQKEKLPDEDSNLNLNELEKHRQKINRKNLVSCKDRLLTENQQNEEYFKRKVVHLKEKLDALKKFNDEVIHENMLVKNQYEDLLVHFEELQDELENKKHCKSCEDLKSALDKNFNDSNALKTSNSHLSQDVDMLKNVVYRLNVQMERYQEKLRKHNLNTKAINQITELSNNFQLITNEAINGLPESHLDHSHTPISWGSVHSHTLGPLLSSYQETMDEKDEIIQNYELELSHFSGRLQEVVVENEKLHKRLTEDDECSAKLTIELDKVKHDLKNARNENDLLIKKCALKQDKLQEVLQCYEQKVEQLKRDYNVVVEQYHKSRTEIAALKEKNKSLIDSQDEFKNERQNYIPLSTHNSSVNECKKWYEELKLQYEQEKSKMKENIDMLHNQISDSNITINNIKTAKEEMENKLNVTEKALKKMERKCLELQHSFHEVQLSRSACRKQLHKAMYFAKDLVTEQESLLQVLHHRQQENKAVKQIGSDIANRMDCIKNQLKTVQRDAWQELSTVEQRLHDQDSIITEMKREHNQEVERLKEIIRQKNQNNLLLKDANVSTALPYVLFKDKNTN